VSPPGSLATEVIAHPRRPRPWPRNRARALSTSFCNWRAHCHGPVNARSRPCVRCLRRKQPLMSRSACEASVFKNAGRQRKMCLTAFKQGGRCTTPRAYIRTINSPPRQLGRDRLMVPHSRSAVGVGDVRQSSCNYVHTSTDVRPIVLSCRDTDSKPCSACPRAFRDQNFHPAARCRVQPWRGEKTFAGRCARR